MELVGTNENGTRVGQYHWNARLSDAEVDQVRDLREYANWTYDQIRAAYGVSRSSVALICRYERRNQHYENWKRVDK